MSDIIKSFKCCSIIGKRVEKLKFYFDTGSPRTFVKKSVALKMKSAAELPQPRIFRGLGDGYFKATHMCHLLINLLGIWVPHLCYVVSDKVLDPNYDVLLGHDFMQIYDIQVKPRQNKVIIKKESLKMALRVRKSCYSEE